ncbi:DMT family transporter [Priestia abyssalis]|uniref:DMT family transporter n=1 Tax=Priestia abyssalis TaxID=1221450 RepID=UPI000995810D|nr:EamA family transporter [Priestia abyssalis]
MTPMYWAVLMILSLIWGGSFYFIKVLLNAFEPWTITFFRCLFGLVTIIIIMMILKIPFKAGKFPLKSMIAVSLFNTAIPWMFIAYSEQQISSGLASILNATTPIWTILVGLIFFKAATTKQQWIGILVAFIGLIILLNVDTGSMMEGNLQAFGAMMLAAISYAFASQISKHGLGDLSVYHIALGTLLGGMMGSGIMAFLFEEVSVLPLANKEILRSLIGIGVFGSGIANILFYYLIKHGKPETAEMVTYLIPASALIWGALLLDEHITVRLITGLLFILAGILVSESKLSLKKQKTAEELQQ